MAADTSRKLVFPLPWPAGSYRAARRAAWNKLHQVAPTLKVPPGATVELEFVLIPPGRRRPSADYLEGWLDATQQGFVDYLRCSPDCFSPTQRFASVPTPGGEVLVKLRVVPGPRSPQVKYA